MCVLSLENEPISDPPSPRGSIEEEEEEPVSVRVRPLKRLNNSPPVSSFLDMTFWKR